MDGIKQVLSKIWKAWKAFGEFIGNIVGRVFLMVFYLTIALPFGLVMRLFNDPLDIKERTKRPVWVERKSPEPTIDVAYKQF